MSAPPRQAVRVLDPLQCSTPQKPPAHPPPIAHPTLSLHILSTTSIDPQTIEVITSIKNRDQVEDERMNWANLHAAVVTRWVNFQ
jgi:hypothetical protein